MKWFILLLMSKLIPLCGSQTEDAFTHIYEKGVWGVNEQGNGYSGSGSTLANTERYRTFLSNFLKSKKIRSVVDAGCGDWTFSREIDWGTIKYTGIDVVGPVIERNRAQYATENIQFLHGNFIAEPLFAADLLICKEVLQHLTNVQVMQFIKKISKFKYCLLINDVNPATLTCKNSKTHTGGYRTLDLTKPPFNLKAKKVMHYPSVDGNGGTHMKQVLLIENKKI